MTSAGELWIFAGVIVLGQFSPGPDMILLTRTALGKGSREGVRMAAGIACGLSVHSTIAVAGMAVAFQRLPVLRVALQWVAAAYLTWLAYGLLRERFVAWYGGGSVATPREDGRSSFVRGLLCNLLNPKAALFLAAVCAPFLAGQRPAWWPYALWSIVVGLGLTLWSLWVVLLQSRPIRDGYRRAAAWIDVVFGLLLLALAIRLMLG
jgi:threonine/homoserine/homoserine lactone efflux protein